MRTIKFSVHKPGADRRHYLTQDDILVLLARLPHELWARLRAVHFNDRGHNSKLGYVNMGHREIALCALPPRLSLTPASMLCGVSPNVFGALRGAQWPELAVRRFMLYKVFLHELGHLQIIDPQARNVRRKFASETLAEEFATQWRKQLWSRPFDHPDPIHRPPSLAELKALSAAHGGVPLGPWQEWRLTG